ncbi:MAG: hypothetical protein ACTSVC_06455 [Promethearchaeota archaeon]
MLSSKFDLNKMIYIISCFEASKFLAGNRRLPRLDPHREEFEELLKECYRAVFYTSQISDLKAGRSSILSASASSSSSASLSAGSSLFQFDEEEVVNLFLEKLLFSSHYLDENDFIEAENIVRQYYRNGINGLAPKIRGKRVDDAHFVFAKPDLENKFGNIFVLKARPLDDQSLIQAKLISWVFEKPIILVGWDGKKIIIKEIYVRDFKFPDIPDKYWKSYRLGDLLKNNMAFRRQFGYLYGLKDNSIDIQDQQKERSILINIEIEKELYQDKEEYFDEYFDEEEYFAEYFDEELKKDIDGNNTF